MKRGMEMKLSKNFLNDYIEIKDKDFAEVADKMVFMGNESDKVTRLNKASDVVIGQIISKRKHLGADKLNICHVDIGESENLQIVCGAPNVEEGQKVVVAKVGSKMGNNEIRQAKIRDIQSNGMICALNELGINNKYLTEEEIKGIHVLDENAPIGVEANKYLEIDDEIIHFDLTANRGDLLSVLGMAYEIGAIYDLEVKLPEITYPSKGENINNDFALEIKTENCEMFLVKKVINVKIGESPQYIKNRLIASEIRPINNVVDISNYVMLETGQPLHFYDADKLGQKILVRMAENGEEIITLDQKIRELTKADIVITDGVKSVGVAGIMGGYETEVTNETTNIIIEAAIFNPVNIRKTSKQLLRSEASNRFEKGINEEMTYLAIERACYLLHKYANGEVIKGMVEYAPVKKEPRKIKITSEHLNQVLGLNLKFEEIETVFRKLKFPYERNETTFTVTIPKRRLDITIAEDLIEEVGRVYGYDKIIGTLPKLASKQGTYTNKLIYQKKIKDRLIALGLKEVITYSLVSEKESFQFINKYEERVKLIDPISIDKSIMRTSLIPSLLTVYNYNKQRGKDNLNIFEIGSIYHKEKDKYIETNTVAGLLTGTKVVNKWQNKELEGDFYVLKGIIENTLNYLGFQGKYAFIVETLKDMHPNRSVAIKINEEIVGFMGQIHPEVIDAPIYVFTINIDKIRNINIDNLKASEVSKFPIVKRDIAFIVKKEIKSEELEKIIRRRSGSLLKELEVFDIYEIDEKKKSIAYSLQFQALNRTLTDEEIIVLIDRIVTKAEKELKAKLRDNS